MVPRMGLGESSREGDSIRLAYCSPKANVGPIEYPHTHRYVIYRFGLPKQDSGDDIRSVITTVYTISRRFDLTQFTSHTQQCLLVLEPKDVPKPTSVKCIIYQAEREV